ncbi:N-acetylmuramoyl-L-alanine amidase-like domain-containing protein [Bdellovibrio bacteriovorus]|uniref:N-acetylmuramoyl-L-alanine amidase-like domain-containing protein n=1 Tax=Bdellovibrio bacteriovorus TaxID=959 RepID=UPI0035A62FC6
MKLVVKPLLIILFAGMAAPHVMAQVSSSAASAVIERSAESDLHKLFNKAQEQGVLSKSLRERVDFFSSQFLGRPYLGGALGEGSNSSFDNDPLFRFDAFDCTTYVETVVALSLASSEESFKNLLTQIRYMNGQISIFTRNHFTSIDWNPNAERLGVLRDITTDVGSSQTSTLETLIEKDTWFARQASEMVKAKENEAKKIEYIRASTQNFSKETARLNFIDKKTLVSNTQLLRYFPKAGVINIVRANWKVKEAIGTALDISHQGIFFERNGQIIFRHASFKRGSQFVVEIPLIDYVKNNLGDSTFAGINILGLNDLRF